MATLKKVKFFLDYGQWPVWFVYNDSSMDNIIPKELPDDLKKDLIDISDKYDDLFINNTYEFSFQGFSNEAENEKFKKKIDKAFNDVKRFYENRYEVENSAVGQNFLN